MSEIFGTPACNKCNYALVNEPARTPQEERDPCPECGSVGRIQAVKMMASISVSGTIPKIQARRSPGIPGKIKPYLERKEFHEVFRKTGRISKVEQIIDRENDYYYYKHVEDVETGEVLKHQEEPLSQHISDREKRQKGI